VDKTADRRHGNASREIPKIGGNGRHGVSFLVPAPSFSRIHEKANGGEGGIRTPLETPNSVGKSEDYTGKDTGFSIALGHDLSRVVTAWAELPAALKAAILAIVDTATHKEGL